MPGPGFAEFPYMVIGHMGIAKKLLSDIQTNKDYYFKKNPQTVYKLYEWVSKIWTFINIKIQLIYICKVRQEKYLRI